MNLLEDSSRRKLCICVTAILLMTLSFSTLPISRPSYAAATSSNTGIVIPLYTYPTDSTWSTVILVHNAYPNVPMIVIADPTSSGSGTSIDQNYVSGIKNLQAAGITVIGYVDTIYAGRSISSVESDTTNWWNWYHPNGIFFDEFANSAGSETYYSALNTFVKTLGMTYTMGNPGTTVATSYYGILDSLIVSENPSYPSLSTLSSATSGYSKSGFGYLAYGVSLDTSYETSSTPYVGWLYITSAGGSNPWDTLPSYFSNEVAALDYPGTTSTSSTTTTTSTTSSTVTSTSTISGAASLSITTQPSTGYYIQSVVDNTLGVTVASGLYTPQTISGTIGHSYSVTVDDYGGYYVTAANVGTFTRTSANGGGGTTVFALQGNTNLAFTMSTSITTTTTTTTTSSPTTTTASTSTTTTPTTTTTTSSASGTPVTIMVRSLTLTGVQFTGMYVTVQSASGKYLAHGFTTFSFGAVYGNTYTVCVYNYQTTIFSHWSGGSTNPCQTVTPKSQMLMTAYYATG